MREIESALQEVTDLISLPEVYLRVQKLMADPSSDIYDFAEVIGVDPNLSARVLKLVNSAYFGIPEPVESIPRAINMIGIGQLHNMVLSVSAISSLELPNDILPMDRFWRVSLFVGVYARLLGKRMRRPGSERLFIAGLLHDIGHLVLYSKFPDQALTAQRIAVEEGKPIHAAEKQVLGQHYGDIGAQLMTNWQLPETLRTLTRHQVEPASAGDLAVEASLIQLGRRAGTADTQDSEDAADNALNTQIQEVTGLSPEEVAHSLNEARAMSADMERVILA